MITSAQRIEKFGSHFFAAFGARIAALQAAGKDVIRLDVGSPDLPPAPHILDALYRSASAPGSHGYQQHTATPAYRAAWSEMYQRVHGVVLDPVREVVPLLGSKEGIFHLASALLNPGDIVLAPNPGYITYTRGALFAGGEPFELPLLPERDYLPDLEAVPPDVARRARLLWLNYPNNPTAAVAGLEFFSQAVEFARRWGILICHDAAYTQVTFEDVYAPSILEVPGAKEVAVEFNTLSKSHNMAGWRVGAAVGNPQALRALYSLKTNVDSGHFLPVLEAATAAMSGDQSWLAGRNEIYRQRRDAVLAGLPGLGLHARTSPASLYVWSSIPPGWTSAAFAEALLEQAHVGLTPGSVFGSQGEGSIRIAFTEPRERILEALDRMKGIL